jgi:hypothetical protein
MFVADFETTTKAEDCRVWAWGLCAIGKRVEDLSLDNVNIGSDMESFIDEISLSNTITYFHNLRFDGTFILDYLLKANFCHTTKSFNEPLEPLEFKSLISDMGQFYSITVKWENGYITEFRDSLKKLPMSVERIADSFKLENSKGNLDYTLTRPVGWKITEEEAEYIKRDVWIVAVALGEGARALTVGSDALKEYKRIIGGEEIFRSIFPVLAAEIDDDIRRAYRGGWTYADPRFTGRITRGGKVYDVNSLYPSVMYYKPIPWGEPEWVDGRVEATEKSPLTIFTVTFTATLRPNFLPCLQIKGSSQFGASEYLRKVKDPTTLSFTNVDWKLLNEHYDIKVLEWHGGWRFKAANGLFDPYIDKWMQRKSTSTGGMRELAKLFLNSLYGKFATNPIVQSKIPTLVDGQVKLVLGEEERREPIYTAAGVFITSFAREITIRAAQANYDTFAYADTDSLHLLTDDEPDIRIHKSDLGAWKHEYDFTSAFYVRAKAYFEVKDDGEYHNALAGVPDMLSSRITFEDLRPGVNIEVWRDAEGTHERRYEVESQDSVMLHGKLSHKAVPGGVILSPVPYELKLA